jgi:hypothetical protein
LKQAGLLVSSSAFFLSIDRKKEGMTVGETYALELKDISKRFDIVFVLTVYAFNDQARLYILRLRTLDIQVNSCANHHFRKALHICLGSFHSVNILAFTKDRHAVRQCKNLLQFMRDNDDRTSVISHVTKDIK